mmetsp:Transcript_8373/g.11000  ORF Transcript_8373/g.11000 Transcript_8373/m.11000 type:complete len:90 (-) Transcript_8373:7-276(-)
MNTKYEIASMIHRGISNPNPVPLQPSKYQPPTYANAHSHSENNSLDIFQNCDFGSGVVINIYNGENANTANALDAKNGATVQRSKKMTL